MLSRPPSRAARRSSANLTPERASTVCRTPRTLAPVRLQRPPLRPGDTVATVARSRADVSPDIKIVEGTMERRSFVEALQPTSAFPEAQVYRVLAGFHQRAQASTSRERKDTFVVALGAADAARASVRISGRADRDLPSARTGRRLTRRPNDSICTSRRSALSAAVVRGRRSGRIAARAPGRPNVGRPARRRARRTSAAL